MILLAADYICGMPASIYTECFVCLIIVIIIIIIIIIIITTTTTTTTTTNTTQQVVQCVNDFLCPFINYIFFFLQLCLLFQSSSTNPFSPISPLIPSFQLSLGLLC
jgi:cytosine/uracil/thiamine/allantoin permease